MNKWMFLFAVTLAPIAGAADMSKSCSTVSCDAGDKATTYIEKGAFYFACPTKELSEYVATVWGVVSVSYQLTGKLPNISPATGEPEYEGQTKEMIDALRSDAKVSTYDQAQALCAKGKAGVRVMVMNNPEDAISIWVGADNQKPFWMPKSFLIKR
ncbi:hypothetical protein [Pseudomonas fluorescens]|uniref:hypothetical protein n=1 Tax=Pseudomonas fluorescens TaxID=294 RepID=UPI003D219C1C